MNLQFAWPWLFLALPLPLLSYFFLPPAPRPMSFLRGPLFEFANSDHHQVPRKVWWRLLLGAIIWILLVAASARPQWVGEPVQLPVNGRDLMLAVDLSGSMKIQDMEVQGRTANRLVAVKFVAGDFIERRGGDRLGLILFGERAYLQTPLTFDRKTVQTLLYESALGLAGEKTAIGDAIGLAVKRLRESPEENRVLILLTDGANTAGHIAPQKAAEIAAAEGIRVYTVGVGADEHMVEGFFGRRVISSDLDEGLLKSIAETTGGSYFRARDTEALQEIYRQLDEIEPTAEEGESFRPVDELYWMPLMFAFALALMLLVIKAFASYRPIGKVEQ